jgi:hypothetical protein
MSTDSLSTNASIASSSVVMTTTFNSTVSYAADGRIFVDQSVLYSVVLATLFSGILALYVVEM